MLAFPKVNFGQAPNLGTASGFALFTASGAFDNAGASFITGDIGSFTYSPVGFPIPGTVVGTIYNVGDPILTSAAADVGTAFGSFGANGAVLGTPLQTYNTTGFINAGTYHTVGAAALNGDFTLDAQGDPNAIFVININGNLTVGAGFNILLKNSASLCNIYWLIDGDFNLGAGSVFRGTVITSGLIELFEASSLLGRGLSTGGAIKLHNNVVTINAAAAGAAGTISGTANVCKGQTGLVYSVPAIANASNYIWTLPVGATITAGANTNSITVSFSPTAASGNITVQGSSGCGAGTVSANFAVTLNPSAAAVAGADRSICPNTSTTLGAAAVSGSTYSWSSVPAGFTSMVSNPTVTPTVTTSYTLVETTTTGCSNSNSVIVTVNPLPAAVAGADRAICPNVSTQIGAAAVIGSTYSWSSVPAGFTSTVANPTVTPLVATTYTVVETTTLTGCTNSNVVVVTVNPVPAAVAGADRAICLGTSTQIGAPAVTGNTYSWTSVPAGFTSTVSNPTVTPLETTTYTLVETITATGCQATKSVTVTIDLLPPTASVITAGGPTILCTGESVTLSGNVGGTWSTGATTPSITVNTSGDYFVTNTSGCGVDVTSNHLTVTVNPLPAAVAGADRSICTGVSTQLGTTAVTGSTYSWTSAPAGFASTAANPTVTPQVTTTYTVVETITATGCTNTQSVVVTVNSLPSAVAGANRSICINTTSQIGAANVTGNTYLWSSAPAGFTSTIANPTVKPQVSTTYTVIVTNTATGCTNSNSVVVSVYALPKANAGEARAICINTSTQIGAEAVSGSTYKWSSVPAGFNSTVANPTVTPLVTTTYRVIETTVAGCANAQSIVVTVNPAAAAFAGADRKICINSITTLGAVAVPGSTYSWSSVPEGFTSNAANPVVSPVVTTTYTVVETTDTGCTNSNSVSVIVNPSPAAIAGADRTICMNSSTQIGAEAVPGNIYTWTANNGNLNTSQANPTVTPLVTTTYALVETNLATGCSKSNSVIVKVYPAPAAVAGADRTICLNSDTRIGAAAVSGSTYSWSSVPAGFTSTEANPTVTPLLTTTYTVVESNTAFNCTNKNNVVVTVKPAPAAIAGSDRAICLNSGTQIGANAVTGNTYSWSSVPAGFTSNEANPTVTPLVTTTYTVVESSVESGCANTNSVVVKVNLIPAAIAGAERTICLGSDTRIGAATVAGSTFSWSSVPTGFASGVANPTVRPLVTTTYTVIETTASGCTNSNSVVVAVNPASEAVAGTDRTICTNTSTTLGAAAVPGSTYRWSSVPEGFNSAVANPTVSPLVTTTYTVVETSGANGCQNTNSVTVSVDTAPIITSQPADQTACVGNPVSFSVSATGTDLTYQWRKGSGNLTDGGNIAGANTATLTIISVKTTDAASNYNVVITGACSSTKVSENASLEVYAAPSISASACVGSSVSFSANATGSGLTYQWRKGNVDLTDGGNISGATSPTLTINPVSASDASPNYNVVITGTCSPDAASLNIGLVVNVAVSITAEPANQVACVGNTAIFTVGTTGTGLTYQWRKGNVNLTNGGNISGANSATLTINPVSAADVASNYNVVVTGPCSSMATSNGASLSLCIPTSNFSLDAGGTNKAITIYPNPFTTSLDIKVNDASKIDNYELRMYNILGEEVMNTRITKDITTLKTSSLASGVYLYEVRSNNSIIQTGKLISKQ